MKSIQTSVLAGLAVLTLGVAATSAVAEETNRTLVTRGPNGAAYIVRKVPIGSTRLVTEAPGQAPRNESVSANKGSSTLITRGPNGAAIIVN